MRKNKNFLQRIMDFLASNQVAIKFLIGGLILFFLGKKVLQLIGLMKDDNEQKNDKNYHTALDKTIEELEKKMDLSNPPGYWTTVAAAIYNDLRFTSLDDNKADAVMQLKKVNNDLDVYELIRQFGTRQEYMFGLPAGGLQDLSAFVGGNLSTSQIKSVNDYYEKQKMNFRW